MALFNCYCKRDCTLLAVIAAVILGIVAAFLQITGVITVTTAFLWVALGIGVVSVGILALTVALANGRGSGCCLCNSVDTVLTGALGTSLLAVILLAVGITATSVVSAILVGLLVAFLALIFGGAGCLIRCLADCDD